MQDWLGLISVIFGAVIIVMAIALYYSRKERLALIDSVENLQNARQENVVRETQRQAIADYTIDNAIGLASQAVNILYVSQVQLGRDTLMFKESLEFVSKILEYTPRNMLSERVGDVDLVSRPELQQKLNKTLQSVPELGQITYVQLIVLMRAMLDQQVGIKEAVNMMVVK